MDQLKKQRKSLRSAFTRLQHTPFTTKIGDSEALYDDKFVAFQLLEAKKIGLRRGKSVRCILYFVCAAYLLKISTELQKLMLFSLSSSKFKKSKGIYYLRDRSTTFVNIELIVNI